MSKEGGRVDMYSVVLLLLFHLAQSMAQESAQEGEIDTPQNLSAINVDRIYQVPNGNYCILQDDLLKCHGRLEDVSCHKKWNKPPNFLKRSVVVLEEDPENKQINIDPGQLCFANVKGLFAIGSKITLLKNVSLKQTPKGRDILPNLPVNSELLVLDYMVSGPRFIRYYKVRYQSEIGYIFAGDQRSADQYIRLAAVSPSRPAQKGETIRVTAIGGSNFRDKLGLFQGTVPQGTRLVVLDVEVIERPKQRIWYWVFYDGKHGKIYGGSEDSSYEKWAVVARPVSMTYRIGSLIDSISSLKFWLSRDLEGPLSEIKIPRSEQFNILKSVKGWYQIEYRGQKGWLPISLVQLLD